MEGQVQERIRQIFGTWPRWLLFGRIERPQHPGRVDLNASRWDSPLHFGHTGHRVLHCGSRPPRRIGALQH